MDLLNDHTGKLFRKFLIPAVSSAIAVAALVFIDIIPCFPNGIIKEL